MLGDGAVYDTAISADEVLPEVVPVRPYFTFCSGGRMNGKCKYQQAGQNMQGCLDDGAPEQFSSPESFSSERAKSDYLTPCFEIIARYDCCAIPYLIATFQESVVREYARVRMISGALRVKRVESG